MVLKVNGTLKEYRFIVSATGRTWVVRWLADHDFSLSDRNYELLETAVEQCKKVLNRWGEAFPHQFRERTLAWKHGVPSLLTRVDFTMNEWMGLEVFEVEDSPSGLGLACELIRGFRRKIEEWKEELVPSGRIVVIRSAGDSTDDEWWTTTVDVQVKDVRLEVPTSGVLAPRVKLPQEATEWCIWPVIHRESKRYLREMGLAEKVRLDEVEKKVEEAKEKGWPGVVFKGLSGSRGRRVRILVFEEALQEAREFLGSSYEPSQLGVSCLDSLGKLLHEIRNHWGKELLLQRFIWPIRVWVNSGEPYFGVFRLFFMYKAAKWDSAGGFLNCRRALKISGSDDAMWIPISI